MELLDLNNSKLFYKLWRNKVIRLRIFYHLNIFYSHKFSREFSINEIKIYKWKEYLQDIILNDDEDGFYGSTLQLPINIEKLSFKLFNQDIYRVGWLDCNKNLTSLNFGKKFNLKLYNGLIPNTIKILNLGEQFNQIIKKDDIPSSVTELIFGNRWNQSLSLNDFTSSSSGGNGLLSITFGNDFNNGESLTSTSSTPFDLTKLPSSLTSLIFGSKFQQFIKPYEMENHLKNLLKLEFHSNYKYRPEKGSIPNTVRELFLGYDSRGKKDEQLINFIPSSVTKLTLGDNLMCPIQKGLIPSSVTSLSLGSNNLLFKDSLPPDGNGDDSSSSLTKLDLGLFYNREIPDGALQRNSIKSIIFSHDFNQELSTNLFSKNGSLSSLDLGYFCKRIAVNVLPSTSLKEIKFNRLFNSDYINDKAMPDSVESIQMVPNFNQNYKNIPKSLTKLVYINFEREFPKDFFINSEILWNQLKVLDLSETAFNRPIEANSLPINLQELKFGFKFNQQLYLEMFPPNLKLLQLGDSFNKSIEPDTLPESLITLIVLGTPKLTQESIPPNLNSIFCSNTNTTFLKSLDYYYFWNFLKIKKSLKF